LAQHVRIRRGVPCCGCDAVRRVRLNALLVCQVDAPLSRRGATSVLVAGLALLDARPASAFLGFGEASKEDVYKEETVRMSAHARLAPGAAAVWSGADGR